MILCSYLSLPDSTYVGVVYVGKFRDQCDKIL